MPDPMVAPPADPGGRPTVAVAMATYNGARHLREQLASIANQSVRPDELIISDDLSSDETEEIIRDFARQAPFPVHFSRNAARLGFAGNFMRAIGLCRSDLIVLCDQDDVWATDKIAAMLPSFDDPQVLLAYHNATVMTADGTPLRTFYDGQTERGYLATQPIHPWHSSYGLTQVFRASLRTYDDLWPDSLNHIAIENERFGHDQWYFFLATVFGRVAFVDQPLVHYRQHGANAVGADKARPDAALWNRIRARLAHSTYHDRLKVRAAERRADLLARMNARAAVCDRQRLTDLAEAYRTLARRLARRCDTHAAPGVGRRLLSLAGAARRGDYAGGSWRFDPRSLVRDLCGALFDAASKDKGVDA